MSWLVTVYDLTLTSPLTFSNPVSFLIPVVLVVSVWQWLTKNFTPSLGTRLKSHHSCSEHVPNFIIKDSYQTRHCWPQINQTTFCFWLSSTHIAMGFFFVFFCSMIQINRWTISRSDLFVSFWFFFNIYTMICEDFIKNISSNFHHRLMFNCFINTEIPWYFQTRLSYCVKFTPPHPLSIISTFYRTFRS